MSDASFVFPILISMFKQPLLNVAWVAMKKPPAKQTINRRQFFDLSGKFSVGSIAAIGMLGSTPAASQSRVAGDAVAPMMPALSRFVAGVRYDAISSKAIETAKTAVMDCLGVALAGSKEESAQIAGRMVREEGAKEEATVFGQRFKSSAVQAAFLNGIAAHAEDFDHSFVLGGQPTAAIIPAVFSLGDSLGVSGK